MFRLQLILFSKITGAFLFRIFGGFLHVPTTQIYYLTGAIISETRITNIYLNNKTRSSTVMYSTLIHLTPLQQDACMCPMTVTMLHWQPDEKNSRLDLNHSLAMMTCIFYVSSFGMGYILFAFLLNPATLSREDDSSCLFRTASLLPFL
jgi:hypothetical protein